MVSFTQTLIDLLFCLLFMIYLEHFWKQFAHNSHFQFNQISSVHFSHSVVSDCLQPHGLQHSRPPCPSPTLGVYSDSCSLSQWCHPIISPPVVSSSCLQSFPASRSFQINQFFATGGQSIGVSASASVFPIYIQDWFPLVWTGWISLQSKGLSRVFSNTAVQKHHTVCDPLGLAFPIWCHVFEVHPCDSAY